MRHESIKSQLKKLGANTVLHKTSKQRIRRNLEQEIAHYEKAATLKAWRKDRRFSASTMLPVALPLLIVGYAIVMLHTVQFPPIFNRDTTAGEPTQRVLAQTPSHGVQSVTPTFVPDGVQSRPSVSLTYADHGHYQYTLVYSPTKVHSRRLMIHEVPEPTASSNLSSGRNSTTWLIRSVPIEVSDINSSTRQLSFTYHGQGYVITASSIDSESLRRMISSMLDAAAKD